MIEEHSRIVLLSDVQPHPLNSGDIGTIVHVYPEASAYEVEFVALDGTTATVATVEASHLRAVGAREMPHSRPLSAA